MGESATELQRKRHASAVRYVVENVGKRSDNGADINSVIRASAFCSWVPPLDRLVRLFSAIPTLH